VAKGVCGFHNKFGCWQIVREKWGGAAEVEEQGVI